MPRIFLVIGQCTPDLVSSNTDHHGATTFLFFSFLETQRGIFMNKVTFPKADKPGLMSLEWNSFGCSSGGWYVPRKGHWWPEEVLVGFAGAPVCCGLSPPPTPVPTICSLFYNRRGWDPNPLPSGEPASTAWEGQREIWNKNSKVWNKSSSRVDFIFFPFLTQPKA